MGEAHRVLGLMSLNFPLGCPQILCGIQMMDHMAPVPLVYVGVLVTAQDMRHSHQVFPVDQVAGR